MKLYAIRDWNKIYENNRSRTVIDLAWVAIPNRHDGENYTAIITHKKGAEIFAVWILLVQVASRCQPRGILLRDNKKPHTSVSLSMKTRAPQNWFETAFEFLEKNTDWLDVKDVAVDWREGDVVPALNCQPPDEEQNRTEQNGMERKEVERITKARVVLHFLNESTGRHFREADSSLSPIIARLSEPDVTLEGAKAMVSRQVEMWKGTHLEEYLRPETLFGKEKFNGYYAGKDQPIIKPPLNGTNNKQNNAKPNHDNGF